MLQVLKIERDNNIVYWLTDNWIFNLESIIDDILTVLSTSEETNVDKEEGNKW